MSQKKVRKAVIAAAGFGTRFLPQTKAMPKEMLPLVDKPIIQYIVEDMVAAGIEDIIIVGSSNKRAIEDHFDVPSADLLANLVAGGPKKQPYIDQIEAVSQLANFIYIRQKGVYGTATPIMNAAHLIGDEPFIYAFADDLTVATPNAFQQMIAYYEKLNGSILPCLRVSEDGEYDSYGILAGEQTDDGVIRMTGITEKPGKSNAPSDFASVGGYLLTPDIFRYLEPTKNELPVGREFYAVDVIQAMIEDGHVAFGCEIKGKRYDTGNKLEYVKTVVDFALQHEELREEFMEHLRSVVNN